MATVYIKPGTGTGTGTASDPYFFDSQLSSAETAAGSGGTILFTDDTYTISATLQLGASNVAYEAVNSRQAVFDFQSSATYGLELGRSADSFAGFSMKGLVFDNIGSTSFNGAVDVEIASGQLLTVNECSFLDMGSTYKAIVGSGSPSPVGALNATFTGCIFTGSTSSSDVDFFRYRAGTTHNLTLNNCTCIFTNNNTNEFFITTTPGSVTVKNSILLADGSGATTLGTATTFTESNNCYYNIGESADAANGIIVDDPQFVDSTTGDYRLRPTSPCINAGTAS